MTIDFNEKTSPISNIVMGVIKKALDFMLTQQQIIELTGLTKSQVHNSLYRLGKKGILINHLSQPELVPYKYWKLRLLYRKFRHLIRIVETRQSKRGWDCDCEATSEGFVPYTGLPIPPERPDEQTTIEYGNVITPLLKSEMIDILGKNGISLVDVAVDIESTCHPVMARTPKFCIVGNEWLNELSATFDPKHDVEVYFKNNVGTQYDPNHGVGVWEGSFTIQEEMF